MQFIEKLAIPGDHYLFLQGLVGQVEAILSVPEAPHAPFFACLGHPHSLQGGSMNNKVVTTLARVFKELCIPSLRFNFRGVGQSVGSYDAGIGESKDMLLLVGEWQKEQPDSQLVFAGFSFGSYVTYRAAAQSKHRLLISVAPAVHSHNYREFDPAPQPWLILQGEADEVVSSAMVFTFAQESKPELAVIPFANTGHFFHGKLLELKAALQHYLVSELLG